MDSDSSTKGMHIFDLQMDRYTNIGHLYVDLENDQKIWGTYFLAANSGVIFTGKGLTYILQAPIDQITEQARL